MGKEEREGDRRRTRKEEKKEGRIADTALRIALGAGRWACGRPCLSPPLGRHLGLTGGGRNEEQGRFGTREKERKAEGDEASQEAIRGCSLDSTGSGPLGLRPPVRINFLYTCRPLCYES
jgi:hypothetical protein